MDEDYPPPPPSLSEPCNLSPPDKIDDSVDRVGQLDKAVSAYHGESGEDGLKDQQWEVATASSESICFERRTNDSKEQKFYSQVCSSDALSPSIYSIRLV